MVCYQNLGTGESEAVLRGEWSKHSFVSGPPGFL